MRKVILILFLLVSVAGAAPKTAADSVYICQSKSSYAYHARECRGLARCTHGIVKVSKARALRLGYRACKICCR